MLAFLPAPLCGACFLAVLILHTAFFASLILLVMPLRFLMPTPATRAAITALLMVFATTWGQLNRLWFRLLPRIDWDIRLPDGLSRRHWYFVIANHQSWVDILVLFHVFNGRTPFLKYFLKQELIWIPFMGAAMYALDFPFMKRYSAQTLARRPELKGRDLATTRRSCEKFRDTPVSVMNFLEGTRFTPAKHAAQGSPYRHLLKPKAGGMAFTLSALGDRMDCLLDTTIVYPGGIPRFWDFCAGRVRHVIVHVEARAIPAEAFHADYETDTAFRARFQAWIAGLWQEKDQLISTLLANGK
ncbi:MAG: acyltransferase [Moraxellaceae bacterium]